MKFRSFLRGALFSSAVFLLMCGGALFFSTPPPYPRFNQFEIGALLLDHRAFTMREFTAHFISSFSRRIKALMLSSHEPPSYDDPSRVISHVMRAMPYVAIVYPSEGYYYFQLADSEGEIGGNLRVNDLERGALGYGYYRRDSEGNAPRDSNAGYLTASDGLRVKKITARLWHIQFDGNWSFILTPPSLPVEGAQTPPLREGEEILSWLRDESGVPFYLVFDQHTPSFFYILDEALSIPDQLNASGSLLIGTRTKFAFFQEEAPRRKILVGVSEANINSNTYFDGPFDQIPAYLPLQKQAYRAYPYLKLGGTDEFGYLCLNRLLRVGITPYEKYSEREALQNNIAQCRSMTKDAREFRHCATFDQKQSYHRESEAFDRKGDLKKGAPAICEHRYLATTAH